MRFQRFQLIHIKSAVPLVAALGLLAAVPTMSRAQGKLVIGNDDWTLSNTGYSNASTTGKFALNVASYFGGVTGSSFLAYSNNMGLNGSNLAATMTGAGYNWTVSTATPFTLANLENYKAVFLGGFAVPSTAILTQYVQAGGDVYLFGGSAAIGSGDAADEAAAWNPFLNVFGLSMASSYNGLSGNITPSAAATDPLFTGVTSLYFASSSDISVLVPANPKTFVDFTNTGNNLLAVNSGSAAPEPGTLPLAALGALPLAGFLRAARRRKDR